MSTTLTAPLDALPPPATAPATGAPAPLPLAVGLSGYLALGALFALGEGELDHPFRYAPTFFVSAVGAVAFTLPALLVLHGSLGLPATPGAVIGALLRSLADTGRVALACTPVVLLFVAAGGIVPVLHGMATLALGGLGLWTGARGLVALRGSRDDAPAHLGLAALWLVVTGVVGLTLLASWIQLVRA